MYDVLAQELCEPGIAARFLGNRQRCRFCGATDKGSFGGPRNAHTFPEALGNRTLFSLDECKACNQRFSVYEDALCKAIGPYLTLGGIEEKRGVRQTGRSAGSSYIKHSVKDGRRHIEVRSEGNALDVLGINPATGEMHLRTPIEGDMFVPLYAYKALMRIALSIMPEAELENFAGSLRSLQTLDGAPPSGSQQVGFSFSHVGNAPPALAGALLRRRSASDFTPYMIAIFTAGNVCFQIWLRSDHQDKGLPEVAGLRVRWTSQLPKPEGGYYPVEFGEPLQLDWSAAASERQPFEAFELRFDPRSAQGAFIPIPRQPLTDDPERQ
ncbi:hypothetical protein ELH33_33035 (plasmid) [Rhizobium ruizarguesonis]|uniref:hypothetical protein n=1 Tax=Rhizobium ruizarguesonis TaxID=2081791 RepID=UPI00102F3D0C|nr:hypothetical protein [Rhizobium ruizarguesonis]TBC25602.1 hypothetical protein ELH33_33035 [Rhizobium ruizarguesonis]